MVQPQQGSQTPAMAKAGQIHGCKGLGGKNKKKAFCKYCKNFNWHPASVSGRSLKVDVSMADTGWAASSQLL